MFLHRITQPTSIWRVRCTFIVLGMIAETSHERGRQPDEPLDSYRKTRSASDIRREDSTTTARQHRIRITIAPSARCQPHDCLLYYCCCCCCSRGAWRQDDLNVCIPNPTLPSSLAPTKTKHKVHTTTNATTASSPAKTPPILLRRAEPEG